eukprot:1174167-Prorocentrum_lima.AAC.1
MIGWVMGFPAMDIGQGKLRYKAWLLPLLLTRHSVLYPPKHAPQSITTLAIKWHFWRAPANEYL